MVLRVEPIIYLKNAFTIYTKDGFCFFLFPIVIASPPLNLSIGFDALIEIRRCCIGSTVALLTQGLFPFTTMTKQISMIKRTNDIGLIGYAGILICDSNLTGLLSRLLYIALVYQLIVLHKL